MDSFGRRLWRDAFYERGLVAGRWGFQVWGFRVLGFRGLGVSGLGSFSTPNANPLEPLNGQTQTVMNPSLHALSPFRPPYHGSRKGTMTRRLS